MPMMPFGSLAMAWSLPKDHEARTCYQQLADNIQEEQPRQPRPLAQCGGSIRWVSRSNWSTASMLPGQIDTSKCARHDVL